LLTYARIPVVTPLPDRLLQTLENTLHSEAISERCLQIAEVIVILSLRAHARECAKGEIVSPFSGLSVPSRAGARVCLTWRAVVEIFPNCPFAASWLKGSVPVACFSESDNLTQVEEPSETRPPGSLLPQGEVK